MINIEKLIENLIKDFLKMKKKLEMYNLLIKLDGVNLDSEEETRIFINNLSN